MFIWRGTGILAPIIIIGAWFLIGSLAMAIGFDDLKKDCIPIFIFQIIGLIIGGTINFIWGKANNEKIVKIDSGNPVKQRHDLFFIPMHYWSFILVPVIFIFAFNKFNKARKFNIAIETAHNEIRNTVDPSNIDLIQNPVKGDIYYFIGHLKSGSTVTAFGKVVEIKSSKVNIFFIGSEPFIKSRDRKKLTKENIQSTFPDPEQTEGVTKWVNISFLKRIYRSKAAKYNDFSVASPLLNAKKGAILHTIYRNKN